MGVHFRFEVLLFNSYPVTRKLYSLHCSDSETLPNKEYRGPTRSMDPNGCSSSKENNFLLLARASTELLNLVTQADRWALRPVSCSAALVVLPATLVRIDQPSRQFV